jgi:DNA-binding transcriptional LysR family regulator
MDLRQLEHAVAVAEERSFTRAAARLFISQPGLSASIRALERDVGTPLFERTTRQVLVTPAGRTLIESAYRILGELADARRALAAVAGLSSGTLAVGVVQTFRAVDVPATLARFHRDHPGVEVTLREAPTADLLRDVQGGELDVAFVALDARPLPGTLAAVRTFAEPLCLVAAPSHRLAGRATVSLGALREEVFVDFQAGQGLQTVVEAVCSSAGLTRRIGFRVSQMDRVLSLVEQGLGVAIVPAAIAEGSGLARIDIAPRAPTRELALVSRAREPRNPAARALLDLVAAPES